MLQCFSTGLCTVYPLAFNLCVRLLLLDINVALRYLSYNELHYGGEGMKSEAIIIVLSGSADPLLVDQAKELGARSFVPKPFFEMNL